MEPRFLFTSKTLIWPGTTSLHYVTITAELGRKIKGLSEGPRRGFGAIKVEATLGFTSWQTSIFPIREKGYILLLNRRIREKENIYEGKKVEVKIQLI